MLHIDCLERGSLGWKRDLIFAVDISHFLSDLFGILCNSFLLLFFFLIFLLLFIWLHWVLVAARRIFCCGMRDLVP